MNKGKQQLGTANTQYSYQSKKVTFTKTGGNEIVDNNFDDLDVQEYQEGDNLKGQIEYEVEENNDLGDDLNIPEGEVVTTHYTKKTVTTGYPGNERIVTQQRTIKGSASGSAITGNRKVQQVITRGANNPKIVTNVTSSGKKQNTKDFSGITKTAKTTINKSFQTPKSSDIREYKLQEKKVDRGGNYNNIQVTHVIYSKKPATFHIIEKLHEDGLNRKPLDLNKLRQAGKLSVGKSSYSCSCLNQKPLKRPGICRSTAYVHCGGQGTKSIELSGAGGRINIRTQRPATSATPKAKKITQTSGIIQRKPAGGAYTKMVKNIKTGIKKFGKK